MKEYDLGFIVPLNEEFNMLSELCPVIDTEIHDAIHYHTLNLPDSDYRAVAVVLGDMGPILASQVTEKVLNYLELKAVVLLGIAGALDKNLKLGDVVVSNEINEFQAASKAVQKGESFVFQYSGNHWKTDFALWEYAGNFKFSAKSLYDAWRDGVRNFRRSLGLQPEQLSLARDLPEVTIGHFASGDTVSASEAYTIELQGIDRKFLTIEMEAAGIAQAAYGREKPVRTMVVRGVSDFADERKKELDSAGDGVWRKYALYSASTFLLSLLKAKSFQQIIAPRGPKLDTFVEESFDIRPIQSMGENIFFIVKKGEPGGFDEFFVKVHFNLWTKYALEIINVDLTYDWQTAMPGPQKISVDRLGNVYEDTDGSYRMTKRRKIDAGRVANIFLSRTFHCNYAGMADYRRVRIDLEVTSSAWDGIKVLTVKGKLNPGGRLDVSEISLHEGA